METFFEVVGIITVICLVIWAITAWSKSNKEKEQVSNKIEAFKSKLRRWDELTKQLIGIMEGNRKIPDGYIDEYRNLNIHIRNNYVDYSRFTNTPATFRKEISEILEEREKFALSLKQHNASFGTSLYSPSSSSNSYSQSSSSNSYSQSSSSSNSYSQKPKATSTTQVKWWAFLNCSSEPKSYNEYELAYKHERLRLKKLGKDIMELNSKFEENKKRFK